MSNHAPKADPVTKLFFLIGSLALLGAVYVLVTSLINTFQKNMTKGEMDSTMKVAAVADNLKPIGSAAAGGAPAANAAGRSGKELYGAVCQACHGTGLLGSPKFGDKADWEKRAAVNGLDGLIASATNGKGSMPAKGGDPSITDEELKAAILYMTKESGLDLGGAAPAAAPAAAKTEAPAAKQETSSTAEAPTTETPAAEAPTTEAPTTETPAAEAPAIEAKPVEAAEEKKQESAPTKTIAEESAPAKETAPVTEEKAMAEKAAEPAAAAVAATAAPAAASGIDGEKIYKSVCFACHATGVAGSPVLGNKEQWAPRIATGKDALYHSALNGKGAMPPKGGNLTLDDAKVKAAVDYMVNQAQ